MRRLRIAATISSSVKSGCSATRASSHSACFSNGDVLPPARLCFGASGVTPALQPFHRGTRTQIEALSGLPPRRSRFDCLDHAFPQIIGIWLRHRLGPQRRISAARFAHRHALGNPYDSTQPEHALASIFLVTLGTACALGSLGSWGARADTIAYYRFETGPAGAVATSIVNSSGHNLNGTILSGAPTFNSATPVSQIPLTGQTDTLSMQFGVADAASFSYPFPLQTLTNATVEVWVYPTMNSTAFDQDLIWGTTSAGDQNRFQMYITQTTNQACLNYREPGGVLHALGCSRASTVPLNQWSYIAYVKQGSAYLIYVNSPGTDHVTTLSSNVIDSSPNLPNSGGWTINGRAIYNSTCCQYSGMLDEIRLRTKRLLPHNSWCRRPSGARGRR